MNWFELLAYVGGFILAFQMIPQITRLVKTESAKDLSYMFIILNIIGVFFMCLYGFHIKDKPLYITTSFSLINTFILLILKIYYDNKTNEPSNTL